MDKISFPFGSFMWEKNVTSGLRKEARSVLELASSEGLISMVRADKLSSADEVLSKLKQGKVKGTFSSIKFWLYLSNKFVFYNGNGNFKILLKECFKKMHKQKMILQYHPLAFIASATLLMEIMYAPVLGSTLYFSAVARTSSAATVIFLSSLSYTSSLVQ